MPDDVPTWGWVLDSTERGVEYVMAEAEIVEDYSIEWPLCVDGPSD